jgi:hypothetical protein
VQLPAFDQAIAPEPPHCTNDARPGDFLIYVKLIEISVFSKHPNFKKVPTLEIFLMILKDFFVDFRSAMR